MAKKVVIPRIDAPIMDKNGNMSLAWYLFLQSLASKGGGGEPGSAATITITQDGETRGSFLLNQSTDETIEVEGPKVDSVNGKQDIVVLNASDVGALPDSTLFTSDLVAEIDSSTYVMTLTMKDQNGDTIGTPQTVDLPLETMVVDGSYDAQTKKIILTLVNGNTIEFSVADLVAGLQSEITSQNKLHADLVDDSTATHKFVTASDKTTWNAKQDAISDLETIRTGAGLGATAVQPNSMTSGTYTKVTVGSNGLVSSGGNLSASDIPDLSSTYYLASNPSGYQANVIETVKVNGTALTPSSKAVNISVPTKVSDLTNDSGFISGITSSMVTSALGYTPYNASNPNGYQANVIESVKVNGTALTITSKAVDVPVPTKVSDLTNDSGYITGISSTMVVNALGYTPVNPSVLATVATTGSYNDLSNKPTIPDAQIQSDWTQSDNTKKDYIKNKPTLATVATSGSYNDLSNKPTLGTAAAADATDFATATQGGKADTAVQPGDLATVATTGSYNDLTNKPSIPAAQIQADWTQSDNTKKDYIKNKPTLATVATSGSYNDLSNKPTIPTVNNASLTIKKNGTTAGTFTANAATDVEVDIAVPTKVSDLTNDSGFITGITYSMVTTALGFTPYSAANPNGYQANVIETVKVNGTALTPSSKAVDVTVPTKVTDLTDHANYVLSSSLSTVATSGSYNDLSNKPTIPDAQIQSDWTQSDNTKKDYIKNKPTLATVATSGSYSDLSNKPTIPTVNNPTITFMQGSTLVGTMTLNQSGNQTFTFAAGSSGSFTPDGTTITTVNGEAKTIAVKNQNSASGALAQVKIWDGSASEYTSQRQAQTLDDNTLCVVKNVSNGADFGLITDSADRGADWGLITDTPGPVSNMALHMGDYVLGTEEDIY